jgi:uncharacterized iron-regulated membrane protein
MVRSALVFLHRWAGLLTATFLVIVGVTGSALAFYVELDRWCAPYLYAHGRPGSPRLRLSELAERAERLVPTGRVVSVTYTTPDQVGVWFEPRLQRATGKPAELGFDEFFLDPWTGAELGRRNAGELPRGFADLMPFVYRLHWTLALGDVGRWLLGLVALVWTVDCFGGLYLALPSGLRSGWRQWWSTAWRIKWRAAAFRVNFDLHRAASLWLWPLLFVFAWSSVMMNIRPAYETVMRNLFDYRPWSEAPAPSGRPKEHPKLDWRAAEETGRRLVVAAAAERGFRYGEAQALMYFPDSGTYTYDVRGSRDVFERGPKGGSTGVVFDGDTGALIEISEPTGEHAGNTVESWLYALHMARVFGMPYRVLVCVLGLVLGAITVTGIYLWYRKRAARRNYRILTSRRSIGTTGSEATRRLEVDGRRFVRSAGRVRR